MTPNTTAAGAFSATTLEELIARHGAWRVLGAAIATLLWRRRALARRDARALSAHLRRDIGMPPVPERPVGRGQFW
jgi:hypothetical protein